MVPGTGKSRHKRNLLQKYEQNWFDGPLARLQKCMNDKQRVKVTLEFKYYVFFFLIIHFPTTDLHAKRSRNHGPHDGHRQIVRQTLEHGTGRRVRSVEAPQNVSVRHGGIR